MIRPATPIGWRIGHRLASGHRRWWSCGRRAAAPRRRRRGRARRRRRLRRAHPSRTCRSRLRRSARAPSADPCIDAHEVDAGSRRAAPAGVGDQAGSSAVPRPPRARRRRPPNAPPATACGRSTGLILSNLAPLEARRGRAVDVVGDRRTAWSLLPRGPAAVEYQICAGHVRGGIGREKHDGAVVLVLARHAAERHALRCTPRGTPSWSLNTPANVTRVDAHVAGGPVGREIARQVQQRRLRRRVGHGLEERPRPGRGGTRRSAGRATPGRRSS